MHQVNLDFTTLNKQRGFEAWNDTFAYWLLALYDPQSSYAKYATEACNAMSFQYDIEGQVHNAEDLIGDAELIPKVAVPIAPVTLAHSWSPFPTAMQVFDPLYVDTNEGETLAVFAIERYQEITGSTPDEQHFLFLTAQAFKQARINDATVLLVGAPGWDYEEEGYLKENPVIQQAMLDFGFVYTSRKPFDN